MTNTPYAPPITTFLKTEEKLCSTCNAIVHKKAEICPKCGVRQRRPASKSALLLITFFSGGIGGHRFYLGNYIWGTLYLLFFWTSIPSIIAFIELIVFLFMSSEKIEDDYTAHGSVVAFILMPIVIGILAAIAIPAYQDYLRKSKVVEAMILFSEIKPEVEAYLTSTEQFPSTAELKSTISGTYVNITANSEELYLQAKMNEKAGSIAGKIIRFSYEPSSKTWICSADFPNGVTQKYLPKNCRTSQQP